MTPEVRDRIEQIRHGNAPDGYKETPSGIVPTEWTDARLGDIYTERKEQGNASLPLLMVSIHSGVSDGEVDEDDLPKKVKRIDDKSQYKRAVKGDLVFNMMRAWQGAIGTVRTEGMVSPAYIVAEPKAMVDPLFMNFCMRTNRMIHTIHRQSYGVTDFRLRLYWDSFVPIQCVLPSVGEQKKIAEILTTQDKIIELEQRKIEEIETVKRYFLSKMFPERGQRVPEIRFKGFTDDWEQRKFYDLVETRRGLTYKPTDIREKGVRVLRSSNIDEDQFVLKPDDVFVDESAINIDFAKENDILITAANGSSRLVGKHAIVSGISDNSTVHGGFMLLGTSDEPYFANAFMSSAWYKRFIDLYVSGGNGAIGNLNKSDLDEQDILVPQKKEQKAIGTFFANLDRLITLHQRKCEELKKQKKALMQLLLTGIVRVSV